MSDELTHRIIACVIRVHQTLGPGFLERVYRRAMAIELRKQGLGIEAEKVVHVHYDGEVVGRYRIDLIVENRVIVELKTVERLNKAHYAQVRAYLKASERNVGLLVNFASATADFRRIVTGPRLESP